MGFRRVFETKYERGFLNIATASLVALKNIANRSFDVFLFNTLLIVHF